MYGVTKLLTADAWRMFQEPFEENSFEVYERRELVIVELPEQTEEAQRAEYRYKNLRLLTTHLLSTKVLITYFFRYLIHCQSSKLEASLSPIINE